jgi:hypothetical protein
MLSTRPLSRMRPDPRAAGFAPAAAAAAPPVPYVPFDHAARFELTGRAGNVLQDVINVGVDGTFVAVAIGYGLEEDRGRPARVSADPNNRGGVVPGDLTLGDLPISALIEGFRVNPGFERIVFTAEDAGRARSRGALVERALSNDPLAPAVFSGNGDDTAPVLFERVKPSNDFSFLFTIVDSATGRELQDEPIHSLASLGRSDGARPFRMFAQPLTFEPRSSVRLQVIERTDDVRGTLFIVFYGYKLLANGCPPPPPAPRPSGRVIPFDYVTTFRLTGRPGQVLEDEVTVNVEGGFVATAIGYALEVDDPVVRLAWDNVDDITLPELRLPLAKVRDARAAGGAAATIDLATLPLRLFPTGALQDGIRIRRDFLRIAFAAGGRLNDGVPVNLLDGMFERLNVPESVSFRYSIFDSGRGIELQNQPLHNLAGLGAADGSRPFKQLLRPLVCVPRSTIRVRVEERFGRGTLFIVFQGFKRLERPRGERP